MTESDASSNQPGQPIHAQWFRALEREIHEEYDRLHRDALQDPQYAGHGGESTWVRIIKEWLPPGYRVVTRRYIIPELGTRKFETDIIVLHPSYPEPLINRTDILAGGVAAAFSVKLTLDAAGIRDGVQRAVDLRRGLAKRYGTARDEMIAPFPVGLLAHSHEWKAEGSSPEQNIEQNLWALDHQLATHPRESLDYLCVADLGLWINMRVPYLPTTEVTTTAAGTSIQMGGKALTTIGMIQPGENFSAVASMIAHLLSRLSYVDPTLRPLSENLRATGTIGNAQGKAREWSVSDVFSELLQNQLPQEMAKGGSNFWGTAIL